MKRPTRKQLWDQRHKIKIQFENQGVICPACSYVFASGFSDVTKMLNEDRPASVRRAAEKAERAPQAGPAQDHEQPVTVCTRCRRALYVDVVANTARVVSEAELLTMNEPEREAIAYLRHMQEVLGEGVS
jgi:hypothetical protein